MGGPGVIEKPDRTAYTEMAFWEVSPHISLTAIHYARIQRWHKKRNLATNQEKQIFPLNAIKTKLTYGLDVYMKVAQTNSELVEAEEIQPPHLIV